MRQRRGTDLKHFFLCCTIPVVASLGAKLARVSKIGKGDGLCHPHISGRVSGLCTQAPEAVRGVLCHRQRQRTRE